MAAGFVCEAQARNSGVNSTARKTLFGGSESPGSLTQATSATTLQPKDVDMSDIYMSDDEDEDVMINQSSNPTDVVDSVFGRKPSERAALDESESVALAAAAGTGSMASGLVLDSGSSVRPPSSHSAAPPVLATSSVGPPGILPPFQPPSGSAFGCGMPLSLQGGDLAQMEILLQENPLLTEQVTMLILYQYPLYASNPLTLRFVVYNELQQLKKFREQQCPPAASSHIRPTTVGGAEGSAKRDSGTDFSESGATFSRHGGVLDGSSSRTSSVTARSVDVGMTRPVAAASASIPHSSLSAWNSTVPGAAVGEQINPWYVRSPFSQASAKPTENNSSHLTSISVDATDSAKRDSGTDFSGSGTDLAERDSSVPEIKSSSSSWSSMAERNAVDNGMKRPADNTDHSTISDATASVVTNSWHMKASRGNASLDSFTETTPIPPTGTLAIF